MSITVQSIRCPDCGATLDIEVGRKQCFCSYCGAKIFLVNENEFIKRDIDEAAIAEANAFKEVELEKIKSREIETKFMYCMPIILIALSFLMIIAAVLLMQ